MLEDMIHLIRNRERPKTLRRFLIVWMKRCYFALPLPLLRLMMRSILARRSGAKVGRWVKLGHVDTGGCWSGLSVGDGSSLGRCAIALHDKVTLGRNVVINDGAQLLTGTHDLHDPAWSLKKAPISIGDFAWIATNAIILPGVSIGRGAVVGAGAVVREDVPDYALAFGNPAEITPGKRTPELDYCPVLLNAPFEAWVGRQPSSALSRKKPDASD